jgi:List-Bact-rpt repeat protein
MLKSATRIGLVLVLVAALPLAGCALGAPQNASNVTATSAILHGSVGSSLDGKTTYWFKYAAPGLPLRETPHRTISIADRTAHPVAERVSGLRPSTTYVFRTCAQDPDQTEGLCAYGTQRFTTSAAPAPTLTVPRGTGLGRVQSSPTGIDCINGSGSCSASFPVGSAVTLSATAADGYATGSWSGACASATGSSCSLTLASDATASADFTPNCPSAAGFGPGNWPPSCWRPYSTAGASTSPFNRVISESPSVEPASAAIVNGIVGARPQEIVAAPGDLRDGGVPIYWAQPGDPMMTLHCNPPPDWDPCPIEGMQVRVPVEAQPAGGYDPPPWDHDAHMTVVDAQSGWEYDFYNGQERSGSQLTVGYGGRTRLDGDGLGSTAVAAHYGGLAGIIRIQELQAGSIDHALLISVPCTRGGDPVYPASADGAVCSDPTDKPAMGARFQLDMSQQQIDALNVPAWQKTIYTALHRYGAYLSDTTEEDHWGFEIESPSTYEGFSGYGGASNPWAQFASSFGIDPVDFNEDTHPERWFYWTQDGVDSSPLSIDWHRMRVLQPCSARGTC